MGLLVRRLGLADWRSFERWSLEPCEGLTVLVGKNAAGKTNTVEALQLLTAGQSFRKPRSAQLVREGAESGLARMELAGDGRLVDVACKVTASSRAFELNGKRCQAGDLPQTHMSVLFCPDDLEIVKRGASHRRDELDSFGRQANAGYGRLVAAYARAVEQRNRLLREEAPDPSLLAAWDLSVATGAGALVAARVRLFDRLAPVIAGIYETLAGGERLTARYVSSLGREVSDLTRDQVRDLMLDEMERRRDDELRRQMTLVGPQRDDVLFTVGGRDARAYGSQGQQRTVVLAWKMAEVELALEVVGETPLLLLDDVMSELDEGRRDALTSFVQGGIQTVVTTTNLGYFPDELLRDAEVVEIGG